MHTYYRNFVWLLCINQLKYALNLIDCLILLSFGLRAAIVPFVHPFSPLSLCCCALCPLLRWFKIIAFKNNSCIIG